MKVCTPLTVGIILFTLILTGKCNIRLPGVMMEGEDPCSGYTCDKCMASGTDCGWCADPKFDELRFPRCQNFQSNQSIGNCSPRSVIQPRSKVLKRQISRSPLKIFNEKKIISTIRPGTELSIQLNGTIPKSIRGRKTTLKIKIIGSKHRQLTHSLETDCKIMNQKKPNLIICKRISTGATINITLDLKLKTCLGAKHRSKLLLRVRTGNVKQTIHVLAKDTCKCSCKSRKQKKRQNCVYNGRMALGNCKCVATDVARLSAPRLGGREEYNANEDSKSYPQASDLVGCENCDVKSHCTEYGLCVECLAFFNSPMPRRMCGPFCTRGFPLVTKVLGVPGQYVAKEYEIPDREHDNVCSYTDKDGCLIRYREIEDGIIEVGAVKDCPKESPSCSNATCIGENGLLCSGHGTCKCGQCTCESRGGYSGPTCSKCEVCNSMCDPIEPCIRCLEFRDYSQEYKSASDCQVSCQQYSGVIQSVNFFSDSSLKHCEYKDELKCMVRFGYKTNIAGNLVVELLRQRVCPEGGWLFN